MGVKGWEIFSKRKISPEDFQYTCQRPFQILAQRTKVLKWLIKCNGKKKNRKLNHVAVPFPEILCETAHTKKKEP